MSELSDRLRAAIRRSEDGAGTLSARESVKLRPADYHAICDQGRAIADALDAQSKLLAETVEGARVIAEFPITDPAGNQDAHNMAILARALLTKLTGTSK